MEFVLIQQAQDWAQWAKGTVALAFVELHLGNLDITGRHIVADTNPGYEVVQIVVRDL